MRRIILLIMVCLLLIPGMVLAQDKNIYETENFSVTFPVGWKPISNPNSSVIVAALAPSKNTTIGITMIPTQVEPNINETIENFKRKQPELQVESRKQIKIADQDAWLVKFKSTKDYLQVTTFHHGDFHYSILMFGTLDTYQEVQSIYEDTATSFRIKPTTPIH